MIRFSQKMTVVYEVRYGRREMLEILGIEQDPIGIPEGQLAQMIIDRAGDPAIYERLVEDAGEFVDADVIEDWQLS